MNISLSFSQCYIKDIPNVKDTRRLDLNLMVAIKTYMHNWIKHSTCNKTKSIVSMVFGVLLCYPANHYDDFSVVIRSRCTEE